MRGFAVFGVIFIHSGLVFGNHTTGGAGMIRTLCGFAVPFFLFTSFFFAIRGEGVKSLPWNEWLRNRSARILAPYAVWSVFYLGLRVGKFYFERQTGRIAEIFSDPWMLLLNGGSSMALYFLPLLFTGLVLVRVLRHVLCRGSVWILGIGLLLTTVCYQLELNTGNAYDMAQMTGPNVVPPLKLFLVLLADAVRCLPLIFIAAVAVRWLPSPNTGRVRLLVVLGVLLCVTAAYVSLNRIISCYTEPAWGLGIFLLAWSLSGILEPGKWITVIGAFSFGVYLVHQTVLEAMQFVVQRIHASVSLPAGVLDSFIVTAMGYGISMIIVGLASRGGPWLRRIFALR
ncbi:MAG: acyltransferase [Methylacidiphilales bacterium]|nr:acyltransferase [Candidatus Methylacidiphilales bacterium]